MIADCYKTKSIKRSEQLSIKRGQSEKIYIASLLSKVPSDFHNSILRKSENKKQVFELIFEYTEREAYFFLEPLGRSEITLLSEKKCILMNTTARNELLHLWSSQEEPDTKLIVHSHEILKESSSKVSIHFSSGDTDVLLVIPAHLYEYEQRIYIMEAMDNIKKHKTKQYYLRKWKY